MDVYVVHLGFTQQVMTEVSSFFLYILLCHQTEGKLEKA